MKNQRDWKDIIMDDIEDYTLNPAFTYKEETMNSSDYYRERLTENMTDSLNVEYELTYAEKRKATPVFSGVLMYFPDAINIVAQCSQAGNDQHHSDKPLHWDRAKSGDEKDALTRHLMEAGTMDNDGIRHSAKVAWRALANLQKELEESGDAPLSQYNVTKQ